MPNCLPPRGKSGAGSVAAVRRLPALRPLFFARAAFSLSSCTVARHRFRLSLSLDSRSFRLKMSTGELACTYASLILFDDGQEVTVRAQ